MNTNIKALSSEELEVISGGITAGKVFKYVALGMCAVSGTYLAFSLFKFKRDVNNAVKAFNSAISK